MRPPHLSRASSTVTFLPARPSSRAAIRPAAPAPMTIMWSGAGLTMWQLSARCRCRIRVLDPIAQKHRSAFQNAIALQRHRRDWRTLVGFRFRRVEDARRPFRAVHRRTEDEVELVDEARTQESAVGSAPAFQQQAFHAKFT